MLTDILENNLISKIIDIRKGEAASEQLISTIHRYKLRLCERRD